jgi:hypothetical protein
MKVAFCLGGAPRFNHRGLFRMVNALQGIDQIDFFIRTWQSEYGKTDKEFEAYLRANLPDHCDFKVTLVLPDSAEHYPPAKPPLNIAPWSPNFLIMWWQMLQSYQLCSQYMELTGEQYDLIFRMRTDTLPDQAIDVNAIAAVAATHMIHGKNFNDTFFFGPPDLYARAMGYWDYLDTLSATHEFIHPEESLEKYYQILNIPYKQLDAQIGPAWDPGEYKGRGRGTAEDTWDINLPT